MYYTVGQIAQRLGVEAEIARGLVKYLLASGLALPKGERRPIEGRGRAEQVYGFVQGFEALLADGLTSARLTN